MAKQIGTADNMEDLFSKIVNFVSSDSGLVALGQNWEVLRLRSDNLEELTSNITPAIGSDVYRRPIQTARYEPRSLGTDNPTTTGAGSFYSTATAVYGTSNVRYNLRVAKEIRTIRMRSALNTVEAPYMVQNFRLQWSDDDSTWTTAYTATGVPVWSAGETRDFTIPGSAGTPGVHKYWRVIVDSSNVASRVGWASLLLLEADGTIANHFGSEVYLRGPGLAGDDDIYVGIRTEYSESGGWYNFFLNGFSGFNPNEQSFFDQPGAIPNHTFSMPKMTPMVPLWNQPMPYWLAVSGRSIRLGVKVSSNYEGMYLGFFLPYATPSQYPYPLAIGGSLVPQTLSRSASWRYSYVSYHHGVYPGPGGDAAFVNTEAVNASLYLRGPDAEWLSVINRPNNNSQLQPESILGINAARGITASPTGSYRSVYPHGLNAQWTSGLLPYRECLGGGYMAQPVIMYQRLPSPGVYGEFEGIYAISGFSNASENTTTIEGVDSVILQNSYRTAIHEYWAMNLPD